MISRNVPEDASTKTEKPEVLTDSPQITRHAGLANLLDFSSR